MSIIQSISKFKALLTTTVLLAGVFTGIFLLKTSLDNRQYATTPTGTAKFSYTLVSPGLIRISASGTGQSLVDGFQLMSTFTGSLPADLILEPVTVSGLSPVVSTLTDSADGKKLTLAFITANPQSPFQANSATIQLATVRFTPPSSGTMVITTDQVVSKITQSATGVDILGPIETVTISHGFATTPSPFPSVLPTSTPTPFPTIVPTETARPTVVPTLLPTVLPTTRPTSTPLPTTVPTSTPAPQTGSLSQTYSVSSANRDVNEDEGKIVASESSLWIGNQSATMSYTAIQFATTLSRSDKIRNAYIEFSVPKEVWIPLQIEVRGLAAIGTNHTQAFSNLNRPSLRSRTQSSVLYSTDERSPAGSSIRMDVTPVLQEILLGTNFGSDQERIVAFLLRGTGKAYGKKFVTSYESDASKAPKLIVQLDTISPPTASPTSVPTPTTRPSVIENMKKRYPWLQYFFR